MPGSRCSLSGATTPYARSLSLFLDTECAVSISPCRQQGYPSSGAPGTIRFAWMLVPVHDAFVFEAPLEHLATVATLTESVMVQTVQEWFPELRPRAEINITHPECWNLEGNFDSVERFIEVPTLSL